METTTEGRTASGACPSYFKAQCRSAAQGGPGYRAAGYQLAGGLHDLSPYDVSVAEWLARLDDLENKLDSEQDVIAWFKANLPRCIALVPPRRRSAFVAGLIEGIEATR